MNKKLIKQLFSLSRKLNAVRNNRWVKLTVFTILMTAMVWQICRINLIYLRFDTVVDVNVERQSAIQLPAFTICLDVDLKALGPLRAIYPHRQVNASLTDDEKYQLYRSTPINKLFEHTVILNDVTVSCLLICTQDSRFTASPSCLDVPCHKYSEVRETIAWARNGALRRCDTYFHWNESGVPFLEPLNVERDLINFNLTKTGNKPVTAIFAMHSGSFIPWTEDHDFSPLTIGLMSIVSINYQLTKIKLLEPPYVTNCEVYARFGVSGWVGCMNQCKTKYTDKEWPLDVPAGPNVSIPFVSETRRLNDTHLIEKINLKCHSECARKQCTIDEYTHQLKYTQYNLSGGGDDEGSQSADSTRVTIHRPFNFDVVYKHRPAIDSFEYLSHIGSAIGLWFGFSCLTLFNLEEIFFKNLIQGRRRLPKRRNSNRANNNKTSTIASKKRPPNISITLSPLRANNLILPQSTNLSPSYNKTLNQMPDDVILFNGPLTS